jgi:hypothetical protein
LQRWRGCSTLVNFKNSQRLFVVIDRLLVFILGAIVRRYVWRESGAAAGVLRITSGISIN